MNEYDNNILLNNVRFLVKQSNRKMGEVEEAVGVSPGYLSRIGKSDNFAKVPVNVVSALAHELKVTVDTLIGYDLSSLSPNEQYVGAFLEKLIAETKQGTISWERFSADNLAETVKVYEDGSTSLPLLSYGWNKLIYCSSFGPDDGCMPTGDFYATDLNKGHTRAFLMKVKHPQADGFDYELYFYDILAIEVPDNKPEPVCGTDPRNPAPLDAYLHHLYSTVAASVQNVRLSPNVQRVIGEYLGADDDDDDNPFIEPIWTKPNHDD